jgi:hypothetical protein
VSGAVRGTAGCSRDNWTSIHRSDRLFYCYTETDNSHNLEQRVVDECAVRMLSELVVATRRHSPRNLAHAHVSLFE